MWGYDFFSCANGYLDSELDRALDFAVASLNVVVLVNLYQLKGVYKYVNQFYYK